MTMKEKSISDHYGVGGILQKIKTGLNLAGKDTGSLCVDDLAPIDEFHTRGRDSTTELATMSPIKTTDHVLDVGCGLGGSARHLADTYDCHVTGIDLTDEYIEVAKQLTEYVGMQDQVQFHQGSALDLPFNDQSFDVSWTEHAQMNIPDKNRFYAEIARVTKPGGCLLFHDIFRGTGAPTYPLPWAEDDSISALATEIEARRSIEQAGFRIMHWVNKVEETLEFFDKVLTKIEADGPPPLGIHLLMGENAKQKLTNYVESMKRNQISVALGVVMKD